MDRWLSAVGKDPRDVPLPQKIANDKLGDIQCRRTQVQGVNSPDGTFTTMVGTLLDPLLSPLLTPGGI